MLDPKTKITLTLAVIFAGLGLLLIFSFQNSGKFRFITCDVGQGDGMLLVSPSGKQIVVDGGPGTKITDCLSANMPFWDRTVELVVATHAQKDHMEGLLEVLSRYKVKMIATTKVNNGSELYRAWEKAVKEEKAKVYVAKKGDQIILDHQQGPTLKQGQTLSMDVLWPPFAKASEGGPSTEQWWERPPRDLNEAAIVLRANYGGFCAYLTADIPKETLQGLIDKKCQILKISHHGSKSGTNQEILDKVNPQIAVIQVGKNSFGHPTKEVLDMLVSKGVKTVRTDTNGVIEIEIDGEGYKVQNR